MSNPPPLSGIYKFRLACGLYVGRTENFARRMLEYSRGGKNHPHVVAAVAAGAVMEVICTAPPGRPLAVLETTAIEWLRPFANIYRRVRREPKQGRFPFARGRKGRIIQTGTPGKAPRGQVFQSRLDAAFAARRRGV